MSASLLEHVFSLEDLRGEGDQRHALLDIVLLRGWSVPGCVATAWC